MLLVGLIFTNKELFYMKKCVICGFSGAVDRHHIIPRSENGENSEDNIILLCPNCHRRAHRGVYKKSMFLNIKQGIKEDTEVPGIPVPRMSVRVAMKKLMKGL